MLGVTFAHENAGKLPIEPPYDVSFCEYVNRVLPEFSIYYYKTENSVNIYDRTKEIKGLDFEAVAVFAPDSKNIVQIVGDTKEGKLSFLFTNGIEESDEHYKKALKLMKKLIKVFP